MSGLCHSGYPWWIALALMVKAWVVGRSLELDIADGHLLGIFLGSDRSMDFARVVDDILLLPREHEPYMVCRRERREDGYSTGEYACVMGDSVASWCICR